MEHTMSQESIHPKFAGLPMTIDKSEVLASKYAAEVNKAGAMEDNEVLSGIMEEWDDHLKREGITISNKVIEVLSEVTLACNESGKKELAGRLAGAIVDMANNISRQYMSSISLADKMSGLVSSLHDEVDELRKSNSSLTRLLPRLKVAKSFRSKGRKMVSATSGEPGGNNGPVAEMIMEEDETEEPQTPHNSPTDHQGKQTGQGTLSADTSEDMTQDPEKPSRSLVEMDVNSSVADKMRYAYRKYYSDNEFSSFSQEKQVAVLDYYIGHILSVDYEWVKANPKSYSMLVDLIDKAGMIRRCKDAKAGTLDNAKIREAVEEISTAIIQCAPPYGPYTCSITTYDHKPILVLKKEEKKGNPIA